jgi:hypothetical protein
MVGSGENPHYLIPGVSPFARIFSFHLSRAAGIWTEASLLFHVVALDQDTLLAHVEGFTHRGRSGAL